MADFEFTDHTPEAKADMERKIKIALEKIGLLCEGYAKKECPVDTGNLRNSISHEVGNREVIIGSPVEYAPYVEMGTSRTPAQPYLRPAIQDHMAEYQKIVESVLKG